MIDRTIPISAINREISQIAKSDEVVAVTMRGKPVAVIVPYERFEELRLTQAPRYDVHMPDMRPRGLRAFLRRLFA